MGAHEIVEYCFSSDNASCLKETRSTAVYVILYIFFISVAILTVCGNLMVIISISHFKQLHTPTNLLLLSLAVADFLSGLIMMPFLMIMYIETCWYFGMTFCYIFTSVFAILSVTSLINVVFISIDRYFAVCDPLQYSNKITVNVISLCIILSWSFAILYSLMIVVCNINFKSTEGINTCLGECLIEMSASWVILDIFISFILPCSIMIFLYIKIFIVAKRHAQVITSVTEQLTYRDEKNSNISKRSERKAAKTLGIVMAVFLLCWMPYYIANIVAGNLSFSSSPAVINYLIVLAYLNCTLNPIIYALFYPWFQKSVREIFTFRICDPASTLINLFPENH